MKAIAEWLEIRGIVQHRDDVHLVKGKGHHRRLFAVSQDLAVGDEAGFPHIEGGSLSLIKNEKQLELVKSFGWYKVLGEVSQHAKWVNARDEIEVEQRDKLHSIKKEVFYNAPYICFVKNQKTGKYE